MISAKVIADSINPQGVRITTLELEYPRIVHSELMTHRVFSRNSASSRAIPVAKVIEMVLENPAMPVHWGKNQAGMQAKEELGEYAKEAVRDLWIESSKVAVSFAKDMEKLGAHKQVINRILEPYQWMKVVLTSTEWANWDWLRLHEDADPTIRALAKEIKYARDNSFAIPLKAGEWHMPYVTPGLSKVDGSQFFYDSEHNEITLEEALKISASCCAQVSYRKSDDSLEKAEMIYSKLVESEPCHASPTEHQAQVFDPTKHDPEYEWVWPKGVTHIDEGGTWWSGNFRDYIQHRQLIPANAKYN